MTDLIKKYFLDNKLNALLITNLANIRYLTGFTGSNGTLLITPKAYFFLTDFRYLVQAKKEIQQGRGRKFSARHCKIVETSRNLPETLLIILGNKKLRLGFEAAEIKYSDYLNLKKGLHKFKLIPLKDDPAYVRQIKSYVEIKKLTHAFDINKLAFGKIKNKIKPGLTEIEVARMLEAALRECGAERLAFDTIIASGKNGASPHAKPTNKKLKRGELVTVDFGAVYGGYHADETITFCLGKPSKKQTGILNTVLEAQKLAINKIKPGVKCAELDKIARGYIASKGYGKYFGHSLGHGVGLEIHERPILSPHSKDIIKPGMVFTIEPGIYLPNFGGVRIEDVFVCAKNGYQQLTKIKKTVC